MAWSKPYTVNTGAGGDSVYNGFVKTGGNVDDIYTAMNLLKNTHTGTSAPSSPDTGQLWEDTNHSPSLIKKYNGSVWVPIFHHAPRGFLINGKISVTVSGNDLIVAIKNMRGNDPTTSDPVLCRIGDTIRIISAALSVTKADGTNWCNSGGAELATKEVDYFCYLGYNATDGVVIGFSRYPAATNYSDFSATTTDEKYCGISTITTAAATDYYELIGRFSAYLSAGAGYTWSVPTFTASNLIQKPIYESRRLLWVPTIVGFSGTPTVVAANYKVLRDSIYMEPAISGTSNATNFTITMPWKALVALNHSVSVMDNTALKASPGNFNTAAGSNVATLYSDYAAGAWTNSGTKQLNASQVNVCI